MINSQRDRRCGRFEIDAKLIERAPKAVLAILQGCIVVRAEFMYPSGTVHYVAEAEHFDPLAAGQEIPWYAFSIKDLKPGTYEIKWSRRPF